MDFFFQMEQQTAVRVLDSMASLPVYVAGATAAFALGWWACSRTGHFRSPGSAQAEEIIALIKARRSIFPKDYTGEAVERDRLEMMLEASNWAPTHGKTEPWRFVVMERDSIARFFCVCSDAMRERFGSESEKFKAYASKLEKSKKDKAKCAFVVAICMKRKALPDKLMPEWEEVAATACAVQNMHLMATSLGIAGYWSSGGPLDHTLVLEMLGLNATEGDRSLPPSEYHNDAFCCMLPCLP